MDQPLGGGRRPLAAGAAPPPPPPPPGSGGSRVGWRAGAAVRWCSGRSAAGRACRLARFALRGERRTERRRTRSPGAGRSPAWRGVSAARCVQGGAGGCSQRREAYGEQGPLPSERRCQTERKGWLHSRGSLPGSLLGAQVQPFLGRVPTTGRYKQDDGAEAALEEEGDPAKLP